MPRRLAQLNVSRLVAPLDAPELEAFVEALGPVNARADAAPGFVWRLQTDGGDATGVRVGDDPRLLVNLSVWESLEALEAFTFHDEGHRAMLRGRAFWFERSREPSTVLWWVEEGHRPTLDEALARLELLRREGPTPAAFGFRTAFPADAAP